MHPGPTVRATKWAVSLRSILAYPVGTYTYQIWCLHKHCLIPLTMLADIRHVTI
jgi:hypothetical protein